MSFSLQTSLISPNFPARQPPGWWVEIFRVFRTAVAAQGSFWADWEVRGGIECGFAHDLWVGCEGSVYDFRKCRFIPPHQSLTRQLPPKGKPLHPLHFSQQDGRVEILKLGCFCNSACFLIFVCFPKLYSPCSHGRIKGFPLGGRKLQAVCRVKRLMRGDKSAFPIEIYRSVPINN